MFDGKEAQIVFVRDVTDSVNFEETLVNQASIKSTVVSDDLKVAMTKLIDKVDVLLNCKHEAANKLLNKSKHSSHGDENSEVREGRVLSVIN